MSAVCYFLFYFCSHIILIVFISFYFCSCIWVVTLSGSATMKQLEGHGTVRTSAPWVCLFIFILGAVSWSGQRFFVSTDLLGFNWGDRLQSLTGKMDIFLLFCHMFQSPVLFLSCFSACKLTTVGSEAFAKSSASSSSFSQLFPQRISLAPPLWNTPAHSSHTEQKQAGQRFTWK